MSSIRSVFLLDDQESLNGNDDDCERRTYPCRLGVLRLTCYLAQNCARGLEYIQWGYSFFNSQGSPLQIMEKQSFCNFDLNSFEEFEGRIINRTMNLRRMNHVNEKCGVSDDASIPSSRSDAIFSNLEKRNNIVKLSILKNALNQVFTDYTWDAPDVSSPIKSVRNKLNLKAQVLRKVVFIIASLSNYLDQYRSAKENQDQTQQWLLDLLNECSPAKLGNLAVESKIEVFWIDTSNVINEIEFTNSSLRVFSLMSLYLEDSSLPELNSTLSSYISLKNSLITVSSVLHHSMSSQEKHPSKQPILFILNQQLSCFIDLSIISEIGAARRQNDYFENWTVLKVVASVTMNPSLFSQMIGLAFSCTAQTGKNSLFSTILMECFRRNQVVVVQCQTGGKTSSFGLLRPLTPCVGCLVVPNSFDCVRNFLSENKSMKDSSPLKFTKDHMFEEKQNLTDFEVAPNRTEAFHTSCLEKWAVPQGTDLNAVLNSFKRDESESSAIFKKLQCKTKLPTTSSLKPKMLKTQKPYSAQEFRLPRQSPRLRKCKSANLNVSSRSTKLVQQSLCTKLQKNSKSPEGKKYLRLLENNNKEQGNSTSCLLDLKMEEGLSEETTVITNLQRLYDQVSGDNQCILSCAQTITNVLVHHITSNSENGTLGDVLTLAEEHFLFSSKTIAEKFGTPSKKHRRIREYKLQVLLLMELEIVFQGSSVNLNCAEKVTILLRMLSFLIGPMEFNKFLIDFLKENYSNTLRKTLEEIGEELNFPIFPDESQSSESDDEMPKLSQPNSLKSNTSATSVPSQKAETKRTLIRHSSLVNIELKRQIKVPKILVLKNVKSKVDKKQDKPTKKGYGLQESSLTKKKSGKRNKQEVKKVCRNLFKVGKSPKKESGRRTPAKQRHSPKKTKVPCSIPENIFGANSKWNARTFSNSEPSFFFQELMSSPADAKCLRTPKKAEKRGMAKTPMKVERSPSNVPRVGLPTRAMSLQTPKKQLTSQIQVTPLKNGIAKTPVRLQRSPLKVPDIGSPTTEKDLYQNNLTEASITKHNLNISQERTGNIEETLNVQNSVRNLMITSLRKSPRLKSKVSSTNSTPKTLARILPKILTEIIESPDMPVLTPQGTPKTKSLGTFETPDKLTPIQSLRSDVMPNSSANTNDNEIQVFHESTFQTPTKSAVQVLSPKTPKRKLSTLHSTDKSGNACLMSTRTPTQSARKNLRSRNLSSVFKTPTKSESNLTSATPDRTAESPNTAISPKQLITPQSPVLLCNIRRNSDTSPLLEATQSHNSNEETRLKSPASRTRSKLLFPSLVSTNIGSSDFSLCNNSYKRKAAQMQEMCHISSKMDAEKQIMSNLKNMNSVYHFSEISPETSDLTNRWPIKKQNLPRKKQLFGLDNKKSSSEKTSEKGDDQSLRLGSKYSSSCRNMPNSKSPTETQRTLNENCYEDSSKVSPTIKRICVDMGYAQPSALGLLHLTSSPVLDL